MNALKIIIVLFSFLMASCASPEERKVQDWLNGKMTASAEKIKSVKIVSEDSVLSLVPMDMMYNDCLRQQPILNTDSSYFVYGQYLYHAQYARSLVIEGKKKNADFIKAYELEWRKLYRLEVEGENGTNINDIEVILDVDGSPMLTGREYDTDLALHKSKFYSIQTIR